MAEWSWNTVLDRSERLALAWSIAWPGALVSAFPSLIVAKPGLSSPAVDVAMSLFGLLVLLVVPPWAVRRAVQMDFGAFHLALMRGESRERQRAMTYWESLRVVWLMTWRPFAAILIVAIALAILAFLAGPGVFRMPELHWTMKAALTEALDVLVRLATAYIMLGRALRHPYRGFFFVVDRPEVQAPAPAVCAR